MQLQPRSVPHYFPRMRTDAAAVVGCLLGGHVFCIVLATQPDVRSPLQNQRQINMLQILRIPGTILPRPGREYI